MIFDPELIARATMKEPEAEAFRRAAIQRILVDELTQARVVFYHHPDGRILMDAIRLPAPPTDP